MNKIRVIAQHEFLTNFKKRSFLFPAFGVPIFVIIVWAIIFSLDGNDGVFSSDVGYVDTINLIQIGADNLPDGFTGSMVSFADQTAAREALDTGTIGAYFTIPEDFLDTGAIQLYQYGSTSDNLKIAVRRTIAANVRQLFDPEVHPERLQYPVNLTLTLLDSGRELSESSMFGILLTTIIFVMIFMMASQLAGGFVMSGVVEEKSGHIIEILITSVTPMQMLAGKLIGLGALGLAQLGIWIVIGLIAGTLGNQITMLENVRVPPDLIVISVIYFILSYFMFASIMAGIGVITGSEQESRQYVSLFTFITVLPFFFVFNFVEDPTGPLPVILTLFPLTSGITVIMRLGFGSIPLEQLLASIILLASTSVFVLWASAKIFRWGTLLYGKRPTPRELYRVLRSSSNDIGVSVSQLQNEGKNA